MPWKKAYSHFVHKKSRNWSHFNLLGIVVQFAQKRTKTTRNFCAMLQNAKTFKKPLAKPLEM